MNTQQANANRQTDGLKPGQLSRFLSSILPTVHPSNLPVFRSSILLALLAAGMLAGTAQGAPGWLSMSSAAAGNSYSSDQGPNKAIDNNGDTYWAPQGSASPHNWLRVDFGGVCQVARFRMDQYNGGWGGSITSYKIYVSTNTGPLNDVGVLTEAEATGHWGSPVYSGTLASQVDPDVDLTITNCGRYAILWIDTAGNWSVVNEIAYYGEAVPALVNRPVSDVTWKTATCNGRLEIAGGVSTDVRLLWGENTNAWANTNVVGTYSTATDLSQPITRLKPYTNYYYTFAASSVYGQKVAASPRKFGAGLPAWGADLEYIIQVGTTNYGVHEFTAVGTNYLATATSAKPLTAEYLIVGGGGGGANGGGSLSGGGGAGGYICSVQDEMSGSNSVAEARTNLTAGQSYKVVVGVGGQTGDSIGVKGGDSSFGDIVAEGGGYGATGNNASGDGGSGGGGNSMQSTPGQGRERQGFSGGSLQTGGWNASGGGGAGQVGQPPLGNGGYPGGNGGTGLWSRITGTWVQRAGGGGGGSYDSAGGTGGAGGGGNGGGGLSVNTAGTPGEDGKGGGGGGGGEGQQQHPSRRGQGGGSGTVIVRYVMPVWAPEGTVIMFK